MPRYGQPGLAFFAAVYFGCTSLMRGGHWAAASALPTAAALLASLALLRLRLHLRAQALLWMVLSFAGELASAAIIAACLTAPAAAPGALRAALQCPPCGFATSVVAVIRDHTDWRLGVAVAMLQLPPPLALACTVGKWVANVLLLVVVSARYGLDPAAPATCARAPAPLAWPDVAATAARARGPALESLAWVVALPLAASLAQAAWTAARARRGGGGGGDGARSRARGPKGGVGAKSHGDEDVGHCVAAAAAAPCAASAAGASAAERSAPPPPPPPHASIHAALAARARVLAASPVGGCGAAASSVAYRRSASMPRVTSLSVKVTLPERAGAYEEVAALMPGIVLSAMARSSAGAGAARPAKAAVAPPLPPAGVGPAAGPAAAPRPRLVSFAGFPGCFHALAQVANAPPALTEAAFAEALAALLPEDVQLLGFGAASAASPSAAHAPAAAASSEEAAPLAEAAAAGIWCEPVALPRAPGARTVSVVLPPPLVAGLAHAGAGLRLVLYRPGSPQPLGDLTLPPAPGGWSETELLEVSVPTGAGPLVLLSMLRTAAAAAGGAAAPPHGGDTLLATLPLLVMPEAAAAEVDALWCTMLRAWIAQRPEGSLHEAARDLYGSQFAAFALDLGALVAQRTPAAAAAAVGGGEGPEGAAAAAAALDEELAEATYDMLSFLEANGMGACAHMLRAAAAPPAPAAAPLHGIPTPTPPPRFVDAHAAAADPPTKPSPVPTAPTPAPLAPPSPFGTVPPPPTTTTTDASPHPEGKAAPAQPPPPPRSPSDYQLWKARHLWKLDAWTVAVNVVRLLFGAALLYWNAGQPDAFVASTTLLAHHAFTAVALAPLAVLVLRRGLYLRRRGALLAATVLACGVLAAACARGLASCAQAGPLLVRRPFALAFVWQFWQVVLHRLSAAEQAVAAVGQALTACVVFEMAGQAVPHAGIAAAALGTVALAAALDSHMHRRWRAEVARAEA